MIALAVKYCGHCNPCMEMDKIIDGMKKRTLNVRYLKYEDDYDYLLVLNACRKACVRLPDAKKGITIVVTPECIDGKPYGNQKIENAVLEKLELLSNRKGRCRLKWID
jgi:alkyl hydroperoxide reductase subunit AhpF